MDESAHEVSITKISIKKENLNNDIKEFAETAMNELLGWYGYRSDTKNVLRTCRSHSESNSSSPDSPKYADACGWCGKQVDENSALCSTNAVFCSESCFSHSRRASFKKSKTCDWCRHVRHTVSYVDFQDGATQLQFCSDKCLNQYKMQIFCKETRAHLEMHPHFSTEVPNSATLITPDLWLKNCKTPESRSPTPANASPREEPKLQTSPLPLISVAHPSKLLAISPGSPEIRRSRKQAKKTRKRCPATITTSKSQVINDAPQDLRVRTFLNDLDRTQSTSSDTKEAKDFSTTAPEFRLENADCPSSMGPRVPNTQYFASDTIGASRRSVDIVPPPTILVPYPLILPLPIPIPIPIPIKNFPNEKEKAFKEVMTQTETDEADEPASPSENIDIVTIDDPGEVATVARPLRKRKRIDKPKLIVRNKLSK